MRPTVSNPRASRVRTLWLILPGSLPKVWTSSRCPSELAQTPHPFHGKAARFVAQRGALHLGLSAALRHGFGTQDNRPNGFVIVLELIDKERLELLFVDELQTI